MDIHSNALYSVFLHQQVINTLYCLNIKLYIDLLAFQKKRHVANFHCTSLTEDIIFHRNSKAKNLSLIRKQNHVLLKKCICVAVLIDHLHFYFY